MDNLKEVEVVSTGVYLPGAPIPLDDIEKVLGDLDNIDPVMKTKIHKLKSIMKRVLKACCYFAVDPKTNKPTETITSLSVKAIREALRKASMRPQDIELLVLGTPLSDNMTPPTTPFIQQELGIEDCTEMEIHSNCTSMTKAIEVAYNALRTGKYKNAVVVYSQNPSAFLVSSYYNQEKVITENILLRWFLSDSSGALILKAQDELKKGIKLAGVYNESLGAKLKPSMWMNFGSANFNLLDVYAQGKHHFSQDYQTVNELGPGIQVKGLKNLLKRHNLRGEDINHLLISIPSYKLEDNAKKKTLAEVGIAPQKWFSNVETKGYCGGASLITSLEELIERNDFKPGERTVCFVTESSKWMVGGFILEHIK